MNREEFIKQFCIAAAPQMMDHWHNNDVNYGQEVEDVMGMAEVLADELEKKFYFA